MAESKCHLSSGALEWWVVDGLGLLLWALAFEMPLKTLDFLQCRLSAHVISNHRKMKKLWMLDENKCYQYVFYFFTGKERLSVGIHINDGEKMPTGLSWIGLNASVSPVTCLFLGAFHWTFNLALFHWEKDHRQAKPHCCLLIFVLKSD